MTAEKDIARRIAERLREQFEGAEPSLSRIDWTALAANIIRAALAREIEAAVAKERADRAALLALLRRCEPMIEAHMHNMDDGEGTRHAGPNQGNYQLCQHEANVLWAAIRAALEGR